MKRIFNIRYAAVLAVMALTAACSDSDDWQPGPGVKDGCQQVHFSGSNETVSELEATDPNSRTVTLSVERNTTAGTLTVPVTMEKKSDGLEIPAEVRFEDGQQTAAFNITVTGEVKAGTSYEYQLLLEGDEVDPYADNGGTMRWTGQISFPLAQVAKMWVDGLEDVLGCWHETVKDMGGGKYRINDWMNSGIAIDLTVDANNAITISGSQLQEIYPDTWYSGDSYIYFNEYNSATGNYEYYKFYPHGTDAYIWIDELCTYSYYESESFKYSYYNADEDTYYISLAWLKLNTENAERNWQVLKFKFLADGEEFEDYLPEQPETPDEPGDEVTFTASFGDYYDTFGGSFNVTAEKAGEDGYLFKNFLGCGDDIKITIDDRTTGGITMAGTYSYYYDGLFYLVASNGYAAYVYPNSGATENYINYMYFYTASGTDYAKWNETSKTFELGTYFLLNEDYVNYIWDTLYLKLNE